MPLELTGRQPMTVGEVVVHGAKSGGAGIAHPGDLDRCWLVGEGAQAIERAVAREIDENIDAMLLDELGQSRIREGGNQVPAFEVRAQPRVDFVLEGVSV